jgi:hypothetical protein
MITVLRPLSTSELLDRTFHLYRNHFLMFLGIAAIPQLLILPLSLGGAAMAMRRNYVWSGLLQFAGYMLFYLAFFVSQPPTIVAVSNLQAQKPTGIGSSYSGAKRSFLRVIWIVFLMFVIASVLFGGGGTLVGLAIGSLAPVSPRVVTIFASLVLTIPPLYFALRWMLGWSLAIPATVLEGGSFLPSMRRSLHLSKGSRWRIFVIYFLMGIFSCVVAFVVEFLLLMVIEFAHIRNAEVLQAAIQAIWAICLFVSTSLVGGLATIALTLLYYDERVRKEGYDLQVMMAGLQGVIPSLAAVQPS